MPSRQSAAVRGDKYRPNYGEVMRGRLPYANEQKAMQLEQENIARDEEYRAREFRLAEKAQKQAEKEGKAAFGLEAAGLATTLASSERAQMPLFNMNTKDSNNWRNTAGAGGPQPTNASGELRTGPRMSSGFGTEATSQVPQDRGLWSSFKGVLNEVTPANTIGSGLAGFGASQLFKKPWQKALAGAGAGVAMNLFGGGGSGNWIDKAIGGASGLIGGFAGSMFKL